MNFLTPCSIISFKIFFGKIFRLHILLYLNIDEKIEKADDKIEKVDEKTEKAYSY